MSVTAPLGFLAAGVTAGLKASGQPDLGLLVAQGDAVAAGLFTTNAFPAAPVAVSRRHLAGGRARAVVVNSGQANAGTGEAGVADAEETCRAVGEAVGTDPERVLVCSTGVIGPRVPVERLSAAVPSAMAALAPDGGNAFAGAILTTDTRPKETVVDGPGFLVGGCVKGAGMIAPDLATLLAFLTTDVGVEPEVLDAAVRQSVAPAFNGLTVDGCTSTNDTVLVLASGASGVRAAAGTPELASLEEALAGAAEDLVRRVALDAEGASRALVVQVAGAASEADARTVGKSVAGSLLVKTAVFGGDPNVGRLLQAVGAAGVAFDPHAVRISIGGQVVVEGGRVAGFDREACREAMKEREVAIRVTLGSGAGEATCFGCDLGYEYVRVNAEYTT